MSNKEKRYHDIVVKGEDFELYDWYLKKMITPEEKMLISLAFLRGLKRKSKSLPAECLFDRSLFS